MDGRDALCWPGPPEPIIETYVMARNESNRLKPSRRVDLAGIGAVRWRGRELASDDHLERRTLRAGTAPFGDRSARTARNRPAPGGRRAQPDDHQAAHLHHRRDWRG